MSDSTSSRPDSSPSPGGRSILDWIPTFHEPADAASDQMVRLQLDNLKLRFDAINKDELLSEHEKEWYDRVVDTFARRPDLTWDDAYRLEGEIGWLLTGDRLRQEIAGRLRWAVLDGVPGASTLQTDYAALLKEQPLPNHNVNVYRDFLLQVLEEIHWHSKRKHIRQTVRSQATRRTLLLALIALVIALAPYFFLPNVATNARPASLASLDPSVVPIALFGDDGFWAHFALYTSVTFGFLGAFFSRLISLQRQWTTMPLDELFNASAYHYIILRAGIGIIGALVVYFFLQSGLVEGSVFPKFKELSVDLLPLGGPRAIKWPTTIMLPSVSLALLIMWSFIAGFSESLVSTVLAGAERQFGGAINAPAQAGR